MYINIIYTSRNVALKGSNSVRKNEYIQQYYNIYVGFISYKAFTNLKKQQLAAIATVSRFYWGNVTFGTSHDVRYLQHFLMKNHSILIGSCYKQTIMNTLNYVKRISWLFLIFSLFCQNLDFRLSNNR